MIPAPLLSRMRYRRIHGSASEDNHRTDLAQKTVIYLTAQTPHNKNVQKLCVSQENRINIQKEVVRIAGLEPAG